MSAFSFLKFALLLFLLFLKNDGEYWRCDHNIRLYSRVRLRWFSFLGVFFAIIFLFVLTMPVNLNGFGTIFKFASIASSIWLDDKAQRKTLANSLEPHSIYKNSFVRKKCLKCIQLVSFFAWVQFLPVLVRECKLRNEPKPFLRRPISHCIQQLTGDPQDLNTVQRFERVWVCVYFVVWHKMQISTVSFSYQ